MGVICQVVGPIKDWPPLHTQRAALFLTKKKKKKLWGLGGDLKIINKEAKS